jgi:hypothetical protein
MRLITLMKPEAQGLVQKPPLIPREGNLPVEDFRRIHGADAVNAIRKVRNDIEIAVRTDFEVGNNAPTECPKRLGRAPLRYLQRNREAVCR